MANDIEAKVGQTYQDPPNMSRAGFWTWAIQRLENKEPERSPVNVTPLAFDRLRPAE